MCKIGDYNIVYKYDEDAKREGPFLDIENCYFGIYFVIKNIFDHNVLGELFIVDLDSKQIPMDIGYNIELLEYGIKNYDDFKAAYGYTNISIDDMIERINLYLVVKI